MRKKILTIIAFIITILPGYVLADATGSVTISCSPSAVKAGSEVKCTIQGTSQVEITSLTLGITTSENLEIVSFATAKPWIGNDIDNKKIDIYSEEIQKNTFTIGTLTLKAKENLSDKNEKVTLSSNTFYYDKNEYEVEDVSANIRIASNNNNLSSIKVNGDGAFFDKNKTSFDISVDADKATIVVAKEDSNAKVTGDGEKSLKYGKNTFKIEVTAEDGSKKKYTLNITRPDKRSKDNYMNGFIVINHDIGFDKNKKDYQLTVDNKVSKLCYIHVEGDNKKLETIKNQKVKELTNCLMIDTSSKTTIPDEAKFIALLNGIDINKAYEEYFYKINPSTNQEKKCNDDNSECSYYLNDELVKKFKKTSEIEEYIMYKNNEIFWDKSKIDQDNYVSVYMMGDLKVGTNTLKYTVTAENGDERVYTFTINRKDKNGKLTDKDEMPPPTGNEIYIIVGVLLIISLLVGIYFYRKKQIKN